MNQFQIIQHNKKEYTFKVNIDTEFIREDELFLYYKAYLGMDSKVSIAYVNEIPLLSSGKRRIIINLYKEENQKLAPNEKN